MSKRAHTLEQILQKLREAEVEPAPGATVGAVCRQIGVTDQTYYRWRAEYGGMRLDQAKRLRELERENSRPKETVAEQALDLEILKEAATVSVSARRSRSLRFSSR